MKTPKFENLRRNRVCEGCFRPEGRLLPGEPEIKLRCLDFTHLLLCPSCEDLYIEANYGGEELQND
jgi:hypothetical protein